MFFREVVEPSAAPITSRKLAKSKILAESLSHIILQRQNSRESRT
jgi:hypothetical protein